MDARTHLDAVIGRTQPEEAKVARAVVKAVMVASSLPVVMVVEAMVATLPVVDKATGEANKRRIKAHRIRSPRGNKSLRSSAMVQTRSFVTRRRRK